MSFSDDLESFVNTARSVSKDPEVASIRRRAIDLAREGEFDRAFEALEDLNQVLGEKLGEAASALVDREEFQVLSEANKRSVTRQILAPSAEQGNAVSAQVTREVLIEVNKASGVFRLPPIPKLLWPDSVNYHVDRVVKSIEASSDGGGVNLERAIDYLVKNGGTKMIEDNGSMLGKRGYTVEFYRTAGFSDTCDWCLGAAGFWTTEYEAVSRWHSQCRCILKSRVVYN